MNKVFLVLLCIVALATGLGSAFYMEKWRDNKTKAICKEMLDQDIRPWLRTLEHDIERIVREGRYK